ncbi:Gfo/Idh/MocA family oxidoreductase [Akkermansiaceae bacterium]|nr:Gfo/Idh/MocA family oxidoreductase [Akkermansiaceae bacterium]MDA7930011.1 Gfo/Idh/MocA family oxidoreductase [Akkermansiaceae bacterium]MDA7934083.1 Gfo/Idh/MocA family oxidoreductase [Akkermansiaceae bacterium]MDB4423550.1 Gfo/Idh/MocA family oxidoreductase [bacterium]MDB4489052.1 Gfo/Idh/MocA family oxidoreductase [Akkermansiaceae bacterium]
MTSSFMNRRNLLKGSALAAAPFVLPSGLRASNASGKLNVGFIGVGKRTGSLLREFLREPDVKVIAVCDVDTNRREDGKKRVDAHYQNSDCQAHNDFRKITSDPAIDAVVVVTPDHWHTIQILAAIQNGKDVYAEKPLTHNIRESVLLMDAVKKSGRIVQTGSQQRSSREFRVACELARNGVIGKIDHGFVNFGGPGKACDLPEEKVEQGLDWNMWLGPAPMRPYNSVLAPRGVHTHFPKWRMYTEYGGGMITDWGAHHLDIVQWALGKDESGPNLAKPPAKQGDESGAAVVYDGIEITHGQGIGVHLVGTDGEIQVTRGRFELKLGDKIIASHLGRGGNLGKELDKAEEGYLKDAKVKLYRSPGHVRDFLNCIKSRKQPITNAIVGSRSINVAHLMNLAYHHHTEIPWNPETNTFAKVSKHPEAWLGRSYRDKWKI